MNSSFPQTKEQVGNIDAYKNIDFIENKYIIINMMVKRILTNFIKFHIIFSKPRMSSSCRKTCSRAWTHRGTSYCCAPTTLHRRSCVSVWHRSSSTGTRSTSNWTGSGRDWRACSDSGGNVRRILRIYWPGWRTRGRHSVGACRRLTRSCRRTCTDARYGCSETIKKLFCCENSSVNPK